MNKAEMLFACLDLPLTGSELALLREVAHHYSMGMAPVWGSINIHRENEVRDLFNKIIGILRDQEPKV